MVKLAVWTCALRVVRLLNLLQDVEDIEDAAAEERRVMANDRTVRSGYLWCAYA